MHGFLVQPTLKNEIRAVAIRHRVQEHSTVGPLQTVFIHDVMYGNCNGRTCRKGRCLIALLEHRLAISNLA